MYKATKAIFGSDARKALFKGLNVVATSVGATLGPKGKLVLIQQESESPIVTKDGVTVSKSIRLKDPVERMGAQLIKEAASQTNEVAGDGTTTATVLTHAMVKGGLKLLEAGYPAKELCEGVQSACDNVLNVLTLKAKQLTTSEEVAQIATISANGDRKIGELIAEAMSKVGQDGIVTVEEAKGTSTGLDIVEGMQIDRGYLSPYFVTNSEKMHAAYQDAKVLLVDHKLASMRDMLPLLEKVMQSRTPLLIIAEEVEGEALQGLVVNKVNANLPVVAIKSPGYGQHKEELLQDIACLTGAKIVSSATGLKLNQLQMSDLGSLKKFIVDSKTTTLVANGSTKTAIDERLSDLRNQLQELTLTSEEIQKIRIRMAKLACGVALIKVGGTTEMEMIERKHRIEDALHATKAAVECGIVPGGGMALHDIWREFKDKEDLTPGEKLVFEACRSPIDKIVRNAGGSPDVVVNELGRDQDVNGVVVKAGSFGYNAAAGEYVDMMKAGIIDPVKVTRTAMRNACSVTTTFLSLDAVVVEDE